MEKEKIVQLLMRFDEYEIPFFFLRFATAKIPAIEVMSDKKDYINRQVDLLNDFDLKLLYDDIIRTPANKSFSEELDLDSSCIKPSKIFISHSSEDKEYIAKLVALLDHLGINRESLFCSSAPIYGVPVGTDIFKYLKEQFNSYKLHIIFVLSENYYNSPVALNEMGAAWILQSRETTILLPGFSENDIKGVLDKNKMVIKLDEDYITLKNKLRQFYDRIFSEFEMPKLSEDIWEQYRDEFIENVTKVCEKNSVNTNFL